MKSPKVLAVAAVALVGVAVLGLIFDGPRAWVYPAVAAILCGLSIYLQTRYPETLKHWTRRRIVDTTAVTVLAAALTLGGFMLATPGFTSWTLPVTSLVILATMPFAFARLLKAKRRNDHAAQRGANERDHGTDATT
jgi:predicted permease